MPGRDLRLILADGQILRAISRLLLEEIRILSECRFEPDAPTLHTLQNIREEITVLDEQRKLLAK
jgi:hypothetical protein